jgi:hypothetical protein
MLNRIVLAFNMLKAFYSLLTNKNIRVLFEVAARKAVKWVCDEGVAAAAAAPSLLKSLNVNDLSSQVVKEGFQFIVAKVLPFGPWLLPFLSLLVGSFCVLGFRPIERLDGLSGIWRCMAAMFVLLASFLAV